jgi:hypothetical protein
MQCKPTYPPESPVLELAVRVLHIRPVEFFLVTVVRSLMARDDKSKHKTKATTHRAPRFDRATHPSPLTAHYANAQKMTTRPTLLSHNRPRAPQARHCPIFLIAKTRLKVHPSPIKLSPLKFPNRERMAIHRRAISTVPSPKPQPANIQNPWPPHDRRLIANLELKTPPNWLQNQPHPIF